MIFEVSQSTAVVPALFAPKMSLKNLKCADCKLAAACCHLAGISKRLGRNVVVTQRIPAGGYIKQAGERFDSVYVVKSGLAVSRLILSNSMRQHVVSFPAQGDFIGVEAIASGAYSCEYQAVTSTQICAFPFRDFERFTLINSSFQRDFFRILGQMRVANQRQIVLLGVAFVEERVAAFILMMSNLSALRGDPVTDIELPMSRRDISSFLGMTIETLCRTLSRFAREGLIAIKSKYVSIIDAQRLRAMVPMNIGSLI